MMCTYKTTLVALPFLLCVLICAHSQVVPSHEVRGTVRDFLGGAVDNVSIEFASGQRTYPVTTGLAGTYSIRLQPGTYTVRTLIRGFCPTRRSGLVLKDGGITSLDFEIVTCGTDTPYRPFDEQQLKEPIGQSRIRPLIIFGASREHGAIEYLGFVVQGKYIRPTITYDRWTLRANSITYDQIEHRWTGQGEVTWQDGTTTKTGDYIEVLLRGDPLVVGTFR